MVGGALTGIFFILTLVCWAIWTVLLSLFIAHYTLTILSDSSSGADEVQYPDEAFLDWWWKPILFTWVLVVVVLPTSILLAPLGAVSLEAFGIVWLIVLWILYPLGLVSVLSCGNWLRVAQFNVLGRMFLHTPAMIYVYLITLLISAGTLWMAMKTFTDSLFWGVPAVFCVPMTFLLIARHWGRFAWLSLNHLPRYARRGRKEKSIAVESRPGWPEADLPPENEVGNASNGAANSDEGTDPYTILNAPEAPSFEEKAIPSAPAPAPASISPIPAAEEEDEWSLEKKPYDLSEPVASAASITRPSGAEESDLNEPIAVSKYYDERARKEKRRARKAEEAKRTLPAMSKKAPTFTTALVVGVWGFLAQTGTIHILGNLIVLTVIEFFLIYMMTMFAPKLP